MGQSKTAMVSPEKGDDLEDADLRGYDPKEGKEAVTPAAPSFPRGLVIVFFNFATSILLVNSVKYLYTYSNFKFPLFIASMHMVFSWAATAIFVHSSDAPLMGLRERMRKVLPFTVLQAASIASSNMALTYIYPSYHEMIQSTTPLFTLITCMLLDGARYNCWAYWAMIPVCGGAAISSYSEVNFSLLGSIFSITAVVFRALKTLLQGRLLCDQKVDSVTLCYYMAPFNLLLFALCSCLTEGLQPWRALSGANSTFVEQAYLGISLAVSGFLACAFNILSYLTIKHLSPVGATVIANAKTPATIVASLFIFANPVAPAQVLGFGVTFFGIFLHSQKGRTLRETPDI
mmetsp:Transcript_87423/g.209155  ORF Transcript_87423/g.209155 Transcript_87423/m.209155 type:complete len:346 (+) Transcript_87423:23-1060(+)